MMSTAPPFSLTREQASRLHGYLLTARRAVFALPPSHQRNQTLRLLQAIQGKLIAILDQRTSPLLLLLSREEMAASRMRLHSCCSGERLSHLPTSSEGKLWRPLLPISRKCLTGSTQS